MKKQKSQNEIKLNDILKRRFLEGETDEQEVDKK